jgi:anthranilate/para-aminobenzoate synthase component II
MTRSRTVRRQAERDARKLADAKWKLTLLEPGFRPDRPLVVESASQIEPHVRGMECPVCGVCFHVADHVATPEGRIVKARCPQCGKTPSVYFVLRAAAVN